MAKNATRTAPLATLKQQGEGTLMRRDYHNWFSPRLNRNMELLVFGAGGQAFLVFPTARNRFYEFENAGAVEALASKIDSKQLQLFCVDGIDRDSWHNRSATPLERIRKQGEYENYLLFEVVPLIQAINANKSLGAIGSELGGYQAFNFAMKHPDVIRRCVALSGAFEVAAFMDGQFGHDFYFNNPADYLKSLSDQWFLDRLQSMKIVLAAADQDPHYAETLQMSAVLKQKNIQHTLDLVKSGKGDPWTLWKQMALKFM